MIPIVHVRSKKTGQKTTMAATALAFSGDYEPTPSQKASDKKKTPSVKLESVPGDPQVDEQTAPAATAKGK